MGLDNYIHDIWVKGSKPNLPVLVMIHGYLSGGVQFCKMMRHMRNYFEVHSICLLGMGSSGRPKHINFQGFDDTMDFFTSSIHDYITIKGFARDGKKFHLLGHSLGGMIAGHYALKYEEQIERLILMSPVGIMNPEVDDQFPKPRDSALADIG